MIFLVLREVCAKIGIAMAFFLIIYIFFSKKAEFEISKSNVTKEKKFQTVTQAIWI